MMFNMSPIESMILLLLLTSGSELASMLDPADYFKSRNIPVSVEKMVELATTQPADAKAQLGQLLALRYLAEDAEMVKKDQHLAAVLKKIEAVAAGQVAQDAQGFAKEYARTTAIALGSKLTPANLAIPDNSIRQEAFNMFPKEATLVIALEFRLGGKLNKDITETRKKLMKSLPAIYKDELYKTAEAIGNVRIDRLSLAFEENPQNPSNSKIYVRITGKFAHKPVASQLKQKLPPGWQMKETKNFRGLPIAQFWNANISPAFALIGDNDLVVAGENLGQNNAVKLMETMLDVQRGKVLSVNDGPLAGKLKQVSATAAGLVVGQVPEEIRKSLLKGPGQPIFKSFPKDIALELHNQAGNLQFKLEAGLDNADDAKAFVETTNALVEKGLAELKNPPPFPANFPNPDKLMKGATDLLKSIKLEAKGKSVSGGMTISRELLNAYMAIGLYAAGELKGAALPPAAAPPALRIKNDVQRAWLTAPITPLTLPRNVVACRHGDTGTMSAKLSA